MKVNRKRLTQVVNILIGILNCHPKSSYYIFVKSEVTFCYKTTTVGGPLQISNHWRARLFRLLTSQRCKDSRLDPSLSVSQQVLLHGSIVHIYNLGQFIVLQDNCPTSFVISVSLSTKLNYIDHRESISELTTIIINIQGL